jgi:hypothetical protein
MSFILDENRGGNTFVAPSTRGEVKFPITLLGPYSLVLVLKAKSMDDLIVAIVGDGVVGLCSARAGMSLIGWQIQLKVMLELMSGEGS